MRASVPAPKHDVVPDGVSRNLIRSHSVADGLKSHSPSILPALPLAPANLVAERPDERDDKPRAIRDFARVPAYGYMALALQTKLTVHEPGDEYEQEADRVAEQVTRMRSPSVISRRTDLSHSAVSRKCACNGTCDSCKRSEQTSEESERRVVQRKAIGKNVSSLGAAPPSVSQVLRSPGRPLDSDIRAFMEPRFRQDFSQVRIHSDPTAGRSATEIQARAYTVGTNVVFAEDQFSPATSPGRALLAHELTHVIQQTGGAEFIQRSPADPSREAEPKPQVARIVAFEGDEESAVAYVSYPAHPDLMQEAATVPEALRVTQNTLKPGEYQLEQEQSLRTKYKWNGSGKPGAFLWVNPMLDKSTQERKYDLSRVVRVTILPNNLRNFLEDQGAPSRGDLVTVIRAAEILVKNGIGEQELRRAEHKAHDYFRTLQEVDPVEWAQSLAAQKMQGEDVALSNRQSFLNAANRLSAISRKDVGLVVEFMTDTDQANKASMLMEIMRGDATSHYPYLEGTDFKNREDLWGTATTFSNTFDFELRALAQAVLNATEDAILLVDARYIGMFGTTKSEGHLSSELEKLNKHPQVRKLATQIAYERANPPHIEFVRQALPGIAVAVDQHDATKEHDEKIESLKKQLNDVVKAQSALSIAGLKGFDASDFLSKPTEQVRAQLSGALADGSRRIDAARREMLSDSKFVYGADKVIDLEKAQLHVTAGSSLDQVIDGVVTARLAEKTVWENISEIISLLAALPIPPPAGPILRAVAAGISIGESFNKYAAGQLGADVNFKSDRPSTAGLVLDFVITATGTVADVASIESHAAARAGHEVNAYEAEAAEDIASGGKGAEKPTNLAGEQKDVNNASHSLHLPNKAPPRVPELATEIQAEEFVQQHPPKESYGQPGERFAPIDDGKHAMVEEIDEEGVIACKLYSGKGIPVKCKPPLGGAAPLERIALTGSADEAGRAADLRRLNAQAVPIPKKLSREQLYWKKPYEEYYANRVRDLQRGVQKDAPLTFDAYIKFQKPLLRARMGTGFQTEEAEAIVERLGSERVQTNVGLSREKNPKLVPRVGAAGKESQTKYLDALVRDEQRGSVGISNKAREFRNPSTISNEVTKDVEEMIEKYGGDRYLRRRNMKDFGKQIKVNNLILSYEAARITTVAGEGATPLGMQAYIREVVEEASAKAAIDYPDLQIAVIFR